MSRTEFEADKKHRELINGSCVNEVMILYSAIEAVKTHLHSCLGLESRGKKYLYIYVDCVI